MAKKKPAPEWTTPQLVELVKLRYSERSHMKEYALLFEVRQGTGFDRQRTCDALAMSCWPSSGLRLHGHELKVSRSDWLREIQQPEKANAFLERVHFWWVVAAPGVLELDEVPPKWGVMTPARGGGSLKIRRPATLNEACLPVDWLFFASIMRKVNEQSADTLALAEAEQKGFARGKREGERSSKYLREDKERLEQSVAEFEEAAGVKIARYTGRHLGEAFAVAQNLLRGPGMLNRYQRIAEMAESIRNDATKMVTELSKPGGQEHE